MLIINGLVEDIKTRALKNSRLAVSTLICVILGMVSFFLTQVYFHINNIEKLPDSQVEQIIIKAMEKVKNEG